MAAGVEACDGGGFAVGARAVYMVVGGVDGGGGGWDHCRTIFTYIP